MTPIEGGKWYEAAGATPFAVGPTGRLPMRADGRSRIDRIRAENLGKGRPWQHVMLTGVTAKVAELGRLTKMALAEDE